jgi:hypothetical protein
VKVYDDLKAVNKNNTFLKVSTQYLTGRKEKTKEHQSRIGFEKGKPGKEGSRGPGG